MFNYGMLLLFITALFTKEFRFMIKYKILYFVLLIHFVLLLLTSPQFRFFLPEFVFLFVLVLRFLISYFKINFKSIQFALFTLSLLPLFIVEFVDFKYFTQNKFHQTQGIFNGVKSLYQKKIQNLRI